MRTIIFVILVVAQFSIGSAMAEENERPYHWVCFSKDGLTKVLDRVWNINQFINLDVGQTMNYREFNKTGCATVQIPPKSQAFADGFYQATFVDKDKNKNESHHQKFIFSVYEVIYGTTGQRMYVANSIYPTDYWKVGRNRECGMGEIGQCITLKSDARGNVNCAADRNSISFSHRDIIPEVVIPRQCQNVILMD